MSIYTLEDNTFTYSASDEVTGKVIMEFIELHQLRVPRYIENLNMYKGYHAILDREKRKSYKPDNRLVVNLAKYIVDTFNGFFMGVPVKETHDKDEVNDALIDFGRRNDLDNHEFELAKMCDIYGHAYEYLYQGEDSKTRAIYNSPVDMFIVYEDTIQQAPLFAVRYARNKEDKLFGELITRTHKLEFKESSTDTVTIDPESEANKHYYDGLPIVEYMENEERLGVFDTVKTLINALNNALSAKADDVDYFADAYLVVKGAELDKEVLKSLREDRTINVAGEGTDKIVIEFLQKPSADQTQENLINWLLDLIYQTAMVSNVNDEKFSNASGTALEIKLQPMSNLALTKERKFKSSMQERYRLVFGLPTNIPVAHKDEWQNIAYKFTQNMPRNIGDEVNNARLLDSVVSKETQLSQLSFVDDAKKEIEKMESERPEVRGYDFEE